MLRLCEEAEPPGDVHQQSAVYPSVAHDDLLDEQNQHLVDLGDPATGKQPLQSSQSSHVETLADAFSCWFEDWTAAYDSQVFFGYS